MFKETAVTYLFELSGLIAGFMVALQLGVFQYSSWAIALYPAVLIIKSMTSGLLSGRLTTALHLGTIYPRFRKNTKNFVKLLEGIIVLTLLMSLTVSLFSFAFGQLFWGITPADYSSILIVMISTVALGLVIFSLTIKVAFVSFKRGYDPDTVVYPVMSTVASILITFFYIIILNVYVSGDVGIWVLSFITLAHVLLVLYLWLKNIHEIEFIKILKESVGAVLFVAFMANLTGTALKGISIIARDVKEIFTVYPALINVISDVGSVVGSTATSRLALGYLKPSVFSVSKYIKVILIVLFSSLLLFLPLGILSLVINSVFVLGRYVDFLLVMVFSNVLSVFLMVMVSHWLSIIRFKKGLGQDTFETPFNASFAYLITTISVLIAVFLIM